MTNKKNKIVFGISLIITIVVILYFCFRGEKVYISKEYSKSGKLMVISEYIFKNKKPFAHGKYSKYNENGIVISEGNFVNNEPNGKWKYYYDNGKIKSIHYRKTSEISEEMYEYHQNGSIKKYILYNPYGAEAFIVNYDDKGNLENLKGHALMEAYQYLIAKRLIKTNQYLKVGDTLKYKYLIANIPKTKRSFSIESFVGSEKLKTERIRKKISTVQVDYEEVLRKKGINTIRAIVKYEFDEERAAAIDTFSFDVEVH